MCSNGINCKPKHLSTIKVPWAWPKVHSIHHTGIIFCFPKSLSPTLKTYLSSLIYHNSQAANKVSKRNTCTKTNRLNCCQLIISLNHWQSAINLKKNAKLMKTETKRIMGWLVKLQTSTLPCPCSVCFLRTTATPTPSPLPKSRPSRTACIPWVAFNVDIYIVICSYLNRFGDSVEF